jgi:hypothetical protein
LEAATTSLAGQTSSIQFLTSSCSVPLIVSTSSAAKQHRRAQNPSKHATPEAANISTCERGFAC